MMENWNQKIQDLPGASILQTSEWGEVKQRIGWRSYTKEWRSADGARAAALILQKPMRMGMNFLYVPRGPLLDWNNAELRRVTLDGLTDFAREQHSLFVKIDPDVPIGFGLPGTDEFQAETAGQALLDEFQQRGWQCSPQQIQFANSVWIDLAPSEEEILARMKQKTRYNVRLAEKKGVTVRAGTPNDFETLFRMYAETSARDGFIIRDGAYYIDLWARFFSANMLTPLIATVDEEPVAAIMLFIFAGRAWYIYGMSRDLHREKMPNYLLQWEAIKRAKAAGCAVYDLWGAPDVFNETDRMWGVYQFKRGLGGRTMISPGAYDLPLNRPMYNLFIQTLPKAIGLMRKVRGVA